MPYQLADHTDFDQIMVQDPDGKDIILVKQGENIHAYKNSCPHVGVPLDYGDGKCLIDEKVLLCSLHGAQFEADTGYCFAGPCSGDSLPRVAIHITEGRIYLDA